jgi:nucleoside-diphosphate-sugar epimerase
VIYVTDAAGAILSLATADSAPRRIYNIASGRVVASELVNLVRQRVPDAVFTYKPDPMVMAIVRGYKDWHISCRRAEEDLGWTSSFTVEQMVDDIMTLARARRK